MILRERSDIPLASSPSRLAQLGAGSRSEKSILQTLSHSFLVTCTIKSEVTQFPHRKESTAYTTHFAKSTHYSLAFRAIDKWQKWSLYSSNKIQMDFHRIGMLQRNTTPLAWPWPGVLRSEGDCSAWTKPTEQGKEIWVFNNISLTVHVGVQWRQLTSGVFWIVSGSWSLPTWCRRKKTTNAFRVSSRSEVNSSGYHSHHLRDHS